MWPVTTAGLGCVSHPWTLYVFFFHHRSRHLAAAALCWKSCGLTLSCGGAGWRSSDIEHFHFGLCRAARAAATVAVATVAAMAAVLGLAWTGAAGPRLHEDNSAVILWAEVRAVWRTGVRTWSGKLDLKKDLKKRGQEGDVRDRIWRKRSKMFE